MQDLKFFNSIEELFLSVHTIESNIKTILSVDNYSPAGLKLLKKLILLCTSASITLIQQDYLNDTLALLKIADKADSELGRYGSLGLNWQGRLIMPSLLAFMYFKQQQYTDSLKFLYSMHILIEEIKDAGLPVPLHLRNITNMLTFIVLWKLNRIAESEKYINSVIDSEINTIRGRNLYCLVSVCKAGVVAKKDKNYMLAVTICNEALKKVEKDEISGNLIEDVMNALYFESRAGIDNQEYKDGYGRNIHGLNKDIEFKPKSSEDWLVNQSFITIFYVTCFIPLIKSGTPVIITEPSWKNQKDLITKEPDRGFLTSKKPNFSVSRTKTDVKKPRKKLSLDVSSHSRRKQNIKTEDEDELLQYLNLQLANRGMPKTQKAYKNDNPQFNDRNMFMAQQGPKNEFHLQANNRNILTSQQGPRNDFPTHYTERNALMSQQAPKRDFYIQNPDRGMISQQEPKNDFHTQNPDRIMMMSQQVPKHDFYMQNDRSSLTSQQGPKSDFNMQSCDRSSLTSQQGPKSDFYIQNTERHLLMSQQGPRNEFNIQIPDRNILMSQQGYMNDFNLQLTDRRVLISKLGDKKDVNDSVLSKYKGVKGNNSKEKFHNLSLLYTTGRHTVGKVYNEGNSRISYFSPRVNSMKKNQDSKISLRTKAVNKSIA
ncbi:hypothetical protein SteCoe_29252 [Stentor coeruleus]|uniref:Uncharacterized protein n=1 Tax=Stentor coeruleus TaxID=5963 RepID=A0A1R2B6A9_9CILI|nr:hypothetical protein SteCoe_29252 [Stentor coeruleus]